MSKGRPALLWLGSVCIAGSPWIPFFMFHLAGMETLKAISLFVGALWTAFLGIAAGISLIWKEEGQ